MAMGVSRFYVQMTMLDAFLSLSDGNFELVGLLTGFCMSGVEVWFGFAELDMGVS